MERATVRHGCVPCLTPSSRIWLRRRQRWLLADEFLILQGIDVQKHAQVVSETPEPLKRRLGGNAFCHQVVAAALIAAFSSLDIGWLT